MFRCNSSPAADRNLRDLQEDLGLMFSLLIRILEVQIISAIRMTHQVFTRQIGH